MTAEITIPKPRLIKNKPKPKWCNVCGRKHSRADDCRLEHVASHKNNKKKTVVYEGLVGHYRVKVEE